MGKMSSGTSVNTTRPPSIKRSWTPQKKTQGPVDVTPCNRIASHSTTPVTSQKSPLVESEPVQNEIALPSGDTVDINARATQIKDLYKPKNNLSKGPPERRSLQELLEADVK